MNQFKKKMYDLSGPKTAEALNKRRFEAYYCSTAEEAVRRACEKLQGAYSLVVASPRKLIGARDPFGFKPLCIGKRDNAYIITSETCALDTIGAEFVRDVKPGEVVTISPEKGIESDMSPRSVGEICVRGPQVMLGYYNAPEETAAAFTMPSAVMARTS